MNNFTPANPYTTSVPSGTINSVQFVNPESVQIQWPNPSGGNAPQKPRKGLSFLRRMFG